ncbi:hypothetical protein AAIR98_001165 [Elusimicrobium simillimum]|uniref:hypothetical protein n=1 Tax=Elusimicrobium simillimum TaxID=3143438 RepID=UPI003C6F08D3
MELIKKGFTDFGKNFKLRFGALFAVSIIYVLLAMLAHSPNVLLIKIENLAVMNTLLTIVNTFWRILFSYCFWLLVVNVYEGKYNFADFRAAFKKHLVFLGVLAVVMVLAAVLFFIPGSLLNGVTILLTFVECLAIAVFLVSAKKDVSYKEAAAHAVRGDKMAVVMFLIFFMIASLIIGLINVAAKDFMRQVVMDGRSFIVFSYSIFIQILATFLKSIAGFYGLAFTNKD